MTDCDQAFKFIRQIERYLFVLAYYKACPLLLTNLVQARSS